MDERKRERFESRVLTKRLLLRVPDDADILVTYPNAKIEKPHPPVTFKVSAQALKGLLRDG